MIPKEKEPCFVNNILKHTPQCPHPCFVCLAFLYMHVQYACCYICVYLLYKCMYLWAFILPSLYLC